jgi:lycopene beta-cyclase
MNPSRIELIIAGGGLSGCLAALALAERRPDVSFLLVEQGETFGGNHIWSFFDSDVAAEDRWLVEPIVARRWPDHEIRFPKRSRRIGLGYNSVKSEGLDRLMRTRMRPDQYRLGQSIAEVRPDHVLLDGGERIAAEGVVDARGPAPAEGLDLAWQKFVGRTYRCGRPHGCERPVIMDAKVDQESGYRFVYTLPFSETELMVEDTYYSTSPNLDVPLIGERLEGYVRAQGWGGALIEAEETGILPVLLSGDVGALWPASQSPVARLGLRGGFFHPTTGYSLPDAVRNAVLLTEQEDFSGAALHYLYRDRAALLWEDRRFYQLLNRMLFRAAEPAERYRVLEHFYRLPEPLIARFYAGQLTALDKLRIVSGRPPVSIGRALTAMRRAKA